MSIKIVRYCRCGSSLVLTGPESRRKALEEAAVLFWAGHDTDGHGPTDRDGARQGRAAGEAETIRADVRL